MAIETLSPPAIPVRGRSFMALIIAPQPPLGPWLGALDAQMRRAADFFADRPIVADLAALDAGEGQPAAVEALDALAARDLRLIGVEGIDPALLAGTRWARLPTILQGREVKREIGAGAASPAAPAAPPPAPSLLIDRPVRSGQSIVFEHGDVTVVGPVASGAEVIAGGSIHVYGALRGRAIAGLKTGEAARIFCRRLEAELVAVDGLYRTAEHWGAELQGCAVQVWRDRGTLRLSALD
ncbi:MAG: septum site-determining protein MinC [Caulobacteraceae bacterium]|nr:septum site-determining protein MinC [Caulobacteraceae bacterium]